MEDTQITQDPEIVSDRARSWYAVFASSIPHTVGSTSFTREYMLSCPRGRTGSSWELPSDADMIEDPLFLYSGISASKDSEIDSRPVCHFLS